MTTGAISPKLLSLAWPLVVGNLLQTAYNLADMFWVGRVGAESVAAVSLMFPTAWLFISVAMGITAAAVAVVSQQVGAGDERAAEHAVGQSVVLTVAVGVALALVGYAVRNPLVWVIGARGPVFRLSLDYLDVILVSIPFTFLFFAFRAVLRAAGDTRTAMWLVAGSAGLNIVLDPFLVLGWGPFPAMGVSGAAIATLAARVLAAVAGLYILLDGGWGIRLRLEDLRPDPGVLRTLVDVGYPGTLDGLLRSLSAVAFAALVARFGPIVTAAYGIGLRMMSVSWTVSGAIGQGAATGVGQNLGARAPDRAGTVAWTATAAAMAILFGFGGVAFAFPSTLMRVFIADPRVIQTGVTFLRVVAVAWGFVGGLMVLQGAFRGAGFTKHAMALLAFPLGFGALGLWWGYTATSVVAFVIGAAWFRRGTWEVGLMETGETGQPGSGRREDLPAETESATD